MTQITIKAKFVDMKTASKVTMTFTVDGDDERKPEINQMTRQDVFLEIEGVDSELKVEFLESAKKSKVTVLKFVVKGDSTPEQRFKFFDRANSTVILTIKEAQMSIEDVREEHEGIEYRTDANGIVSRPDHDPNQQTIEELEAAQREVAAGSEEDEHGDDDLKEEI
jgi:hypothetical protein